MPTNKFDSGNDAEDLPPLGEFDEARQDFQIDLPDRKQTVSGTYKGTIPRISPFSYQLLLELRIDIDGRRPQNMVSGDIYKKSDLKFGLKRIKYKYSFQLSSLSVIWNENQVVITGDFFFNQNRLFLSITIPRVSVSIPAPNAFITITTPSGQIGQWTFVKSSAYFRETTLEVDCLEGTAFPPTVNTNVDPHPDDLPHISMDIATAYKRAGIYMEVTHDQILTDPDDLDSQSGWDYGELHDLMEFRFSHFTNSLHWNLYGVIVPAGEAGSWSSITFDWAGGQPGDIYFRRGFAIAYDPITSLNGALDDTNEKKNRQFLWKCIHEAGHAFNLQHPFSRNDNRDSASTSFMNCIHDYTGRSKEYWSDFRWEFDDVELIWMRHASRNDVIFGGANWISNHLEESNFFIQQESSDIPLLLTIGSNHIYDLGEPVVIELSLTNIGSIPLYVSSRLLSEEEAITVIIRKPDNSYLIYNPPLRIDFTSMQVELLNPKQTMNTSCDLFYGKHGFLFENPGEYWVRIAFNTFDFGSFFSNPIRIRISATRTQSAEKLAYLLFDQRFGKFKYLNGCGVYPELISELEEAVETYGKTDSTIIRHVHTVLGSLYGRPMKKVITKNDKLMITSTHADVKKAIEHFSKARSMIQTSSMDITDRHILKNIVIGLALCHLRNKNKPEAEKILNEGIGLLEKAGMPPDLILREKERILKLKIYNYP
jgi:hypothetical protein